MLYPCLNCFVIESGFFKILETLWPQIPKSWLEFLESWPDFRKSWSELRESWTDLPEKMAPNTRRDGPNFGKGHDGAPRKSTRSFTEGVRMFQNFVKILRFISQYHALSPPKKRKKCGLPL